MATVFWGGGWVLVWLAILNSAIANANAGVNAATRVIYAMARNGALPKQLARTHPEHKTPHVATIAVSVLGVVLSLLMGWKWGPLTAFIIIATAVTIVVILVYMTVCLGTFVFYWRERRSEFNPLLHGAVPILGMLAFVGPLYYQYRPLPDYPVRIANWVAIVWIAAGIGVTIWMSMNRRQALVNAERIFVEDETVEPERPDITPRPVPAG